MTRRRWVALAVLLGVSVALGSGVAFERPVPDLTGTWCCTIRCMLRYPDGTRDYLRECTALSIDQYDGSAYFYFDELGLWLDGVVGHKYLVASNGYMGYDYGECTLMDARIGARSGILKGNLWAFELTPGELEVTGGEKDGEEALLAICDFTARRLSQGSRYED